MANKSMTDIAFEIMSSKKRAIPFVNLWAQVSKVGSVSNDKIGQFYNDLSLDSRFVSLKENKWDLKTRRTYDETHIDIAELEVGDDEEDEEMSESNENDDDSVISEEEDY